MNVKSCEKQGSTAKVVVEVERARFDEALETAVESDETCSGGQIGVVSGFHLLR